MTIKELYQRFRQWQKNPMEYHRSKELRHCVNCGEEFHGDYCPTCGQKWDTGPVSWKNLHQEWMSIWGLGSRSLPLTLMQLLLRPGYLIGDYISGKRRNCYSPLSMVLLVTLVVLMIGHWLDLNYTTEVTPEQLADSSVLSKMNLWLKAHEDLAMLFGFMFMLLPTYIVFRYAPQYPRHTLPQGFFIQLFNVTQYVCLLLPFGLICKMIALGEAENEEIENAFRKIIYLLLLFVNYKQLFGYGVWGTLWRVVACFVMWKYTVYLVICLMVIGYVTLLHGEIPTGFKEWSLEGGITTCLVLSAIIISTLCIVLFANWRSRAKASAQVKE